MIRNDEGSRRRLPSWMLGSVNQTLNSKTCTETLPHVNDTDSVTVTRKDRVGRKCKDKSIKRNGKDIVDEEGLNCDDVVVRKKSRIGRKRKVSVDESGSDVREDISCKVVKNSRRKGGDVSLENDANDVEEEMGRDNVKKIRVGRKGRCKNVDENDREELACDDVNNRFVWNHGDKMVGSDEQEVNCGSVMKRRARKCEGKSVKNNENEEVEEEEELLTVEDLLSIAKEYVDADAVTDDLQSFNTQKEVKSSEKVFNSVDDFSCVCPGTGSSTAENAALDMLSLFLGPLLSKLPEQEKKKSEFTEYDLNFSNKLGKASQTDAVEQVAAPKKTKSSLKDKVAMLLD